MPELWKHLFLVLLLHQTKPESSLEQPEQPAVSEIKKKISIGLQLVIFQFTWNFKFKTLLTGWTSVGKKPPKFFSCGDIIPQNKNLKHDLTNFFYYLVRSRVLFVLYICFSFTNSRSISQNNGLESSFLSSYHPSELSRVSWTPIPRYPKVHTKQVHTRIIKATKITMYLHIFEETEQRYNLKQPPQ